MNSYPKFLLLAALVLAALTVPAWCTLIQENFDGYPAGPGTAPGWFEWDAFKGPTWEIIDQGGNHVLRGVSGPRWVSASDGKTGPATPTGWFVENSEMQVSLCILAGSGGGVGIGQCDGTSYVGNSYYVEVSANAQGVGLAEEGLSMGTNELGVVYFPAGTISYGQWYDLRFVSTGTTFQVWFRQHSTAPWDESTEKIIEVPHDLSHPGHKSYVEGWAACWTQNDARPYDSSTVLFDDFRLEALPFPAATTYSDDFENSAYTLANMTPYLCTPQFEPLGGSQVMRLTGTTNVAGLFAGQAQQYYTHNFTMRTSLYLDASFAGGIAFGVELTQAPEYTDYYLGAKIQGGYTGILFVEEVNDIRHRLGTYSEPAVVGWYTLELQADYERYRVWWWPRGTPKPASPIFDVAQDVLHPGYRAGLQGGAGLWQDSHGSVPFWSGAFDDFYFQAIPESVTNTPPGTGVEVTPEPGLTLNFDNVSAGGTTSVETSTTAPGGGPGGLEFQGLYYDIDTTCVFSGPVQIELSYDDTGMTLQQEESLRLMHWLTADQRWEDITVLPVHTDINVVEGETSSLSVFAIAVLPTFQGFLQPINMPPAAMSVFRQKSAVPVKFRLLDAAGAPVPDAEASLWIERVNAGVPSGVNEPFYAAQPDAGTSFRYDAAGGIYIYNLKTSNLLPGIYRLHVVIMGGLMERTVDVAIR